jgi:hypothetical protein
MNTARDFSGGSGTQTSAIVFGGRVDPPPITATAITESWNGTSWTEVADLSTARNDLAGAGADNTSALAVGGYVTTVLAATEEWLGPGQPVGAWSTGGNLNTARFNIGGAGSSNTSALAMGGDLPASKTAVTESYNGSSWTEVNDLNLGRSQSGSGGTQTSALFWAGTVFPGVNLKAETESWNGTSWTEVNDLNTARRLVANGTGADNTNALSIGGLITASSALTESWNGTSWTEVNDLNSARYQAGAAGTNTAALAFGGDPGSAPNYVAITEQWNGTSWTEVNDLNTGRQYAGGAGTSTLALAFGGNTDPVTTVTEEWNGTSWTETSDMSTARTGLGAAGTQTTALGFGGGPPSSAATEEWNKPSSVVQTITTS